MAQYEYRYIDQIYHSTSMYEMQVKADMLGVDMYDPEVVIDLIETTTYHHAFWPHTSKRFTAYKQWLRHATKLAHDIDGLNTIIEHSKKKMVELHESLKRYAVPGTRKMLKNYTQVLKILEDIKKHKDANA